MHHLKLGVQIQQGLRHVSSHLVAPAGRGQGGWAGGRGRGTGGWCQGGGYTRAGRHGSRAPCATMHKACQRSEGRGQERAGAGQAGACAQMQHMQACMAPARGHAAGAASQPGRRSIVGRTWPPSAAWAGCAGPPGLSAGCGPASAEWPPSEPCPAQQGWRVAGAEQGRAGRGEVSGQAGRAVPERRRSSNCIAVLLACASLPTESNRFRQAASTPAGGSSAWPWPTPPVRRYNPKCSKKKERTTAGSRQAGSAPLWPPPAGARCARGGTAPAGTPPATPAWSRCRLIAQTPEVK